MEAARVIEEERPALRRSLFLHLEHLDVETHHLEGRAQIGIAVDSTTTRERTRRLDRARRSASAILRRRTTWADGLGTLLLAGIAQTDGKQEVAQQCLQRAEAQLSNSQLGAHLAAARLLAAESGEDRDGGQLASVVASPEWRKLEAGDPRRLSLMMIPGAW